MVMATERQGVRLRLTGTKGTWLFIEDGTLEDYSAINLAVAMMVTVRRVEPDVKYGWLVTAYYPNETMPTTIDTDDAGAAAVNRMLSDLAGIVGKAVRR